MFGGIVEDVYIYWCHERTPWAHGAADLVVEIVSRPCRSHSRRMKWFETVIPSKLESNVEPKVRMAVSRLSETLLAVGVVAARLGFCPDAPDSTLPGLASS